MNARIGVALLACGLATLAALAHAAPGRGVTFATRGGAVAVNAETNRIYYPDSVIDGATNAVIARYPFENSNAMAVNPVTNLVYRTNFNTASVSVIDGETNTIVSSVPVGAHPGGVAVNATTNRIYVGDDTGISVIDGNTHAKIAAIPAGGGVGGVDVDPVTNRVYAASGVFFHGVIVADGATNRLSRLIPLPGGHPWDVAVDPTRKRLYVVRAGARSDLLAIDTSTHAVLGSVAVGGGPTGVAVNPVTGLVYVANHYGSSAFVVDGKTLDVVQTFAGCDGAPHQIDIDPLRDRAYVGSYLGPGWAIDDAPPETAPPEVGELSFSVNPKRSDEATVLTTTATDEGWGLLRGELRVGPSGSWQAMSLSGSMLSRTVYLPSPDVYPLETRVTDKACKTSGISRSELVVYDPEAGFVAGRGSVVSSGGNASFIFDVRYPEANSTVPTGTVSFGEPGNGFRMRSTALEWMAVTSASWAKIAGTTSIANASGDHHPFRLYVRDGDPDGEPDQFVLRVYPAGANPVTATPIYEASGVPSGRISVQR